MKLFKNISKAAICFSVLVMSACNKDFLETKPLDQFSESDIWGDPVLAEAFINRIYANIPWGWDFNAGNVDESRSRQEASFDIGNCLVTPDNSNWGNWNGVYSDIRRCNTFLEKAESIAFEE